MLSIHLYHHSQQKANIAQNNTTLLVQGTINQQINQGPQHFTAHDRMTAEEETIMIPVEDVVRITSKLDVKKSLQADAQATTTPIYDFLPNCFDGCWKKTIDCCRCPESKKIVPLVTNTVAIANDPNQNTEVEENVVHVAPPPAGCFDSCRCCCCRKQILVMRKERKVVKKATEAQRVITMNIEFSKYSNLNTPTHTSLLNNEHQEQYYKKKFDAEAEQKQQFYLVNNTEFDPKNFEIKKQEAEVLSRTVMQLKGMKGHYPSERELEDILNLNYKRAFGDFLIEPTLQSPTTGIKSAQPTPRLVQAPQKRAIEQPAKTTTISEEVRRTDSDEEFE